MSNPKPLLNTSIYPSDNPYTINNEEYDILDVAFGRLVHHKARSVVNRTKTLDYYKDVSQEIMIAMFTGASKYKRQRFVVGCMEWFQKYPELIPAEHSVGFWTSVWTWQLRAKLGPKHGFRPQHEVAIAAAIDGVDAPVDFRHSPLLHVYQYVDTHHHDSDSHIPLPPKGKKKCDEFLGLSDRIINSNRQVRSEVESARLQAIELSEYYPNFSELPVKPCRYHPFEMDEFFERYIKQIIFNQGDKEKDRIIKSERFNAGSVDVFEFSDFIPDTRAGAMDMLWTNQRDSIVSRMNDFEDPNHIRSFENESDGSFYRGTDTKSVHRNFGFSYEQIKEQIRKIQMVCLSFGKLDMLVSLPKLALENMTFSNQGDSVLPSA